MSVDAEAAESTATCDHCGAADESVEACHLAPIGNLVTVAACADCRRRFGTVEGQDTVGEQYGLTAPDGVCLVCREPGASFGVEVEVPVAGQVGYVAGSVCAEHADAVLATFLNGGDC